MNQIFKFINTEKFYTSRYKKVIKTIDDLDSDKDKKKILDTWLNFREKNNYENFKVSNIISRKNLANYPEYQYLQLIEDCIWKGELKEDRTGTGTLDLFGDAQIVFDVSKEFPLITTKKLHRKSIIHELLWFIMGDTNIKYLNDNGVRIWNEWANEDGDLGPVYGKQWRNASGKDQLQELITSIIKNPHSRRQIVDCWQMCDLDGMALAPCHVLWQTNVSGDLKNLDLKLYQRSADVFLGVPFNIASYVILLYMLSIVTKKSPRKFIHSFGSYHVYTNHIKQVLNQLGRIPKTAPKLIVNPNVENIDDFKFEDFSVQDYEPHPHIKGTVAA